MQQTFTDRLFLNFDKFLRGVSDWTASTVDHYCMLETCDSDHALAANTGALVTLFEFKGALSQLDADEFTDIINGLKISLGSVFKQPGKALQIVFHYDPDQILDAVEKTTAPSLITARNLNMDLEDLVTDWNKSVSRHCSVETCYIAAWTRPEILSPHERKRAFKKRAKACADTPFAKGKQNPGMVLKDLRYEHDGFVELLEDSFKDRNLILKRINAHDALWHIRRMTCPEYTSEHWKALLPGDPMPRLYADPGEADNAGFLYPSIARQLFPREAKQLDRVTIQMGDTIHRPMMLTLPPQNPKPFQTLFRFLCSKKIPWRICMLVEPDGLGGQTLKSTLASILAFTNSDNRRFQQALDQLRQADLAGDTIVKLKTTFNTWTRANTDNALEKLRSQAEILSGAVQAWGTCDITENIGDPLLGVCATIPGLMDRSPTTAAAAPLIDVFKMIPMRPVCIWDTGSMLLRTPDGKMMPYTPMSSKQASWIDECAAPMGQGKSVYSNTINFAFLLQPGMDEMPYISIIDIGPSSSGLISLVKSSLPNNLKHLAAYHRIRMEPRFAINPFDTPLGCRTPLPSHISFLVNLLSLFATPLDKTAPGEGVPGLARMAIERAYAMLADKAQPKVYTPGIDSELAELVEKLDISVDQLTTWWEIVDALFDAGHPHEAGLAQRYAVPLLSDIIGACHQSADLQKMYGADLVRTFTRSLSEAIQAYPIFKQPTKFDIGDARVVSLDLDEVAPKGGAAADRQTAVMYMLGRHVVASRFFVMPEDVGLMPKLYQAHNRKKIEVIRKIPKRLSFDEVHRATRNKAVKDQFVADLETISRESRKWNLSIGLYSQDFNDYPKIITELATTVIILGVGTKFSVEELCNCFGFNSALAYSMANLGKPGPKGANFVAMLKTSEGTVYQTLTNTVSSMALWAFSSTSEDRDVRDALYQILGTAKALRVLAKHYPGGSIKPEIEKRKLRYKEKNLLEEVKSIEQTLIDELTELAKQQ